MRRLALLLAVIVSTVAGLTGGPRRSPLPPGLTSWWT
jgi:hypothetical protein